MGVRTKKRIGTKGSARRRTRGRENIKNYIFFMTATRMRTRTTTR